MEQVYYTTKVVKRALPEEKKVTYSEAGVPNPVAPKVSLKQAISVPVPTKQKYVADIRTYNEKVQQQRKRVDDYNKEVEEWNRKGRFYEEQVVTQHRVKTQTQTTQTPTDKAKQYTPATGEQIPITTQTYTPATGEQIPITTQTYTPASSTPVQDFQQFLADRGLKPKKTTIQKVEEFILKPFEKRVSQIETQISATKPNQLSLDFVPGTPVLNIMPKIASLNVQKYLATIPIGVVKLGLAPAKLLEPGVSYSVEKIKEGKPREIGLSAIRGADFVRYSILEPVVKDVGQAIKTSRAGTKAILSTIGTATGLSKKEDAYKQIETYKRESEKFASSPTPIFVGAVATQTVEGIKSDPVRFLGETTGSIIATAGISKAIQPVYQRVMGSSFAVGQQIKTKLGLSKPIYIKQTPAGVKAIKVQTKGLSNWAIKEKIKRLGYETRPQGVVQTDALGRQYIPIDIQGRPRVIEVVTARGEQPFAGLSVGKTVSEYKPFIRTQEDLTIFKSLTKQLKSAKNIGEVSNIQKQLDALDLKWRKTPPQAIGPQAKQGFAESFESQAQQVKAFGSLGTAQRDVFSRFETDPTTGRQFLKVDKPSTDPIERSLFFSPKDIKTGQIPIRTSRLGAESSSIFELISGKAKLSWTGAKSEIFVTKGTKIADIPKTLKPILEKAKTSSVARSQFAKSYLPEQLKVTQEVKPFGFVMSSESEVIAPSGTIVETTGQIGRTFLPQGKFVPIYDISIPKDVPSRILRTVTKSTSNLTKPIIKTASEQVVKTFPVSNLFVPSGVGILSSSLSRTEQPQISRIISPIRTSTTTTKPVDVISLSKPTVSTTSPSPTVTSTTTIISEPTRQTEKQNIFTPIFRPGRIPEKPIPPTPPIPTTDSSRTTKKESTLRSLFSREPVIPTLRVNRSLRPAEPPFPPRTPPRVLRDKLPKLKSKKFSEPAYDVLVRQKGKWKKIDSRAKRNLYSALDFGASIVDNTVARSFKVERAKGTATIFKKSMPLNINKFYRPSKTKSARLTGAYIERSKSAIDTFGEKKGLSVARFLKRRML